MSDVLANKYGLGEIHSDYLRMMDDFHEYCISKGINYSLSGGSLLGAVRHKGFIPWDDDVDVMFDRPNYEKFLETFAKYGMSGYEIIGTSWVYRLSRSNDGVNLMEPHCIDLFVFDPVPENHLAARIKVLLLRVFQGMLKDAPEYGRFSAIYKLALFLTWAAGRPFDKKTKLKWYTKVSKWGNNGSDKINIYNTWFDQIGRLVFDRDVISEYVLLDFEDRKYMSIGGYDSYLSELYGDYMQLPPEEKRVPTHMK